MSPRYSDEDIARIGASLRPVPPVDLVADAHVELQIRMHSADRWCKDHFQKDDCWTVEGEK